MLVRLYAPLSVASLRQLAAMVTQDSIPEATRVRATEQLLRGDMWSHLWSAHAKAFGIHEANGCVRTKGELDRLFKVDREIDIATGTMHFRSNLFQRVGSRTAPAHRTDQVPLQVQDS